MSRKPVLFGVVAALSALSILGLCERAPRAAGPAKLFFSSNREGAGPKLFVADPDIGDTQPFHVTEGSESLAAWSPDGTKISFCSSRSGNHEIWVMDADGNNVKQLTNDDSPDYVSAWSPDGKKIAFTSERSGNPDIWVMNADGNDQINITNNQEFDGDPAWSPDGKKILFASNRDGLGYRLYTMAPDGSNVQLFPAKQTPGGPVFPAWSADGNRIAFGAENGEGQDAPIEIYTCDADGASVKRLTTLGGVNMYPAWSPDGKRIALYHHDTRGDDGTVWVVNVEDGTAVQIGQAGSFMSGRPSWKPER